MKLENKRIIITGGTSGIGRALCQQLCQEGLNNEVIVIARSADKLQQLKQALDNVIIFQADLSKLDQVEQVADQIIKQFPAVDVLINNAAVQNQATFLEDGFRYETIAQEITLNFTAVCSLCYLLLPSLLHKKRAVILNVNSGLALAPKTSSAIYCGTKGGLNSFSLSLGYQLESTNIKVLQVFLELVDTQMAQGRGINKLSPQEAAARIITGIEDEVIENDIGKVKLLRFLLRLAPSIARRILKRS